MKNDLLKKALPHIIVILFFLVVTLFFGKPALEGNAISQHDILGWKGMSQNAFDYKEKNGHFPLWNTNVFSGMPNYLIAMEGKSILPNFTSIFTLGLPQPINFFFLACVCFYVLCMSLRLKPVVGALGGIAFAFATYNPIIMAAGHVTKMIAISYMPLLLAGIMLTYQKKYWLGIAVSTLGSYLLLGAGHPQISYYFFILAFVITIPYLVNWIKQKDFKHIGIAFGVVAISAIAGISTNALSFLVTSEYSKATIRGGKTIDIEGDSVKAVKVEGLDTSYALQYSLGKAEPITLLMPNAFGGALKFPLDENTKVIDKLVQRGLPEESAAQVAGSLTKFWGDPDSTGGGPLYAGALVCLLALIGFVLYKGPLRWGLLAACILAIFMAWGKYFLSFNLFLFDNLPFYNKFRAPSITMVITQLAVPLMAVIGLQRLLYHQQTKELLRADFKKILFAVGGLLAFIVLMYLTMNYSSPIDQSHAMRLKSMGANDEIIAAAIAGLKADRSSIFGGQVLRTLAYMAMFLAFVWLYMKNMVKPFVIAIALVSVTLIDLLVVDSKYLNEENYQPREEQENQMLSQTAIDQQILADKDPHFRVYDAGPARFSASDYHVSTFHRAVGGYHPAKLRLYQDVIERYLYAGIDAPVIQVLNMLDVKYVVITNPQTNQPALMPNPQAYGAAWFVKHVKTVKDDVEELQSLGYTNLRDTALVQASLAGKWSQPQPDSAATIRLVKYDNDAIEYSTESATPQFAVFSEIYYPYGWNAYIDGKKVEYIRTNYAFRGLSVPAGKHTVKFVFEPESYKKGNSIAYIGSFIILLLILGGLFMAWREGKKQPAKAG